MPLRLVGPAPRIANGLLVKARRHEACVTCFTIPQHIPALDLLSDHQGVRVPIGTPRIIAVCPYEVPSRPTRRITLIGGWMVHTDQLEVGGVVAFISAVGRLNDPWGDLVNYFRDLSITQVKFGLVADRVNQLSEYSSTVPVEMAAIRMEA